MRFFSIFQVAEKSASFYTLRFVPKLLCSMTMKTEIQNIVPDEISNLWNSYVVQKEKGLKKESNKLLSEFMSSLNVLEDTLIQDFVYHLTDEHRNEKLKIDFRLFENVIFPVLISGVNTNQKSANKRLAQFDQFLLPTNPLFQRLKQQLNYKKEYFESADFYEKEIELNNTDFIAIDGLLNRIASGLNYATHELPEHGMLWDFEYFELALKRFKMFLELDPKKDLWLHKIRHWEFVLDTWGGYVNNLHDFESYQDYLKKKELEYIE